MSPPPRLSLTFLKGSLLSVLITTTLCVYTKPLQWCPTLCNPVDHSPPGSSVHGILQARLLECVALPFSRGSSWPRGRAYVSCHSCTAGRFFTAEPLGKPPTCVLWLQMDCTLICSFSLISPHWLWAPWEQRLPPFPRHNPRTEYSDSGM